MTLPSVDTLYDVCAKTWPAASEQRIGPWTVRDGQGGGQRVSAATLEGDFADLDRAEAAMEAFGQRSLFMVRQGEDDLDARLQKAGYRIKDPVNIYVCPIGQLTDTPIPKVTAFAVWEPLHMSLDIWAMGGIGPERVAVMHRCQGPKTSLLGRWNDHPAGTGYCAIHEGIAMVHALEILTHQRGLGVGKWMMRRAAFWAQSLGATHMSVICTQANTGANALYTSLGMELVGCYHYRIQDT